MYVSTLLKIASAALPLTDALVPYGIPVYHNDLAASEDLYQYMHKGSLITVFSVCQKETWSFACSLSNRSLRRMRKPILVFAGRMSEGVFSNGRFLWAFDFVYAVQSRYLLRPVCQNNLV